MFWGVYDRVTCCHFPYRPKNNRVHKYPPFSQKLFNGRCTNYIYSCSGRQGLSKNKTCFRNLTIWFHDVILLKNKIEAMTLPTYMGDTSSGFGRKSGFWKISNPENPDFKNFKKKKSKKSAAWRAFDCAEAFLFGERTLPLSSVRRKLLYGRQQAQTSEGLEGKIQAWESYAIWRNTAKVTIQNRQRQTPYANPKILSEKFVYGDISYQSSRLKAYCSGSIWCIFKQFFCIGIPNSFFIYYV